MSDTPSRSEIESALTGRQSFNRRKSSSDLSDSIDDFELESSRRRQQVIGGALTGVSKRHKKSIFSKFADIHLTNWLAVLLVACILIAFFWPNNKESIREIAEQKIESQSEPFYTESRIDEQDTNQSSQLFSRDDDLSRANQFREEEKLENQIQSLLAKASEHVANGQYTSPQTDNAILTYRQILDLESDNTDAKNGITGIKKRFLTVGEQAISDNDETRAQSALLGLSRIDTESDEHIKLSNALIQWQRSKQINELLAKANTARNANNLILPANASSLHFYREALKLDENNQTATAGVKNIADNFINEANKALLNGDLDAATGYLATASVVDDNHPSIQIVSEMIANAEPIAAERFARNQNQITNEPVNNSSNNLVDDVNSSLPTQSQSTLPPRQISAIKTPEDQASEQEAFDQIYLTQGLEAYYQGDYGTASALLAPLADKGVSRAQFRIGYMYFLGRGFEKNLTEADKVLRAALPAIQKFANEGRSWAQSDLGSLYEDGLVLPRDYAEAIFWYRSAAEQGYPGAQTNLGIMYARGLGVTQSRQTAIEWFKRAAEQGDIAATRNLTSLGVN